jgi:SAM-dependent MidA family methyltransferase
VLVESDEVPEPLVGLSAPSGARVPVQEQAGDWLRDVLALVERGRVVVIDYADTTDSMAQRPHDEWLRTYRGHERGGSPHDAPGSQDITVEVAIDQLAAVRAPDVDESQADFLAAHGIDHLVAEGRRVWAERAHLGDLAAIRARSRITEAEALTDPAGLGAFRVLSWLHDQPR